MFRRNAPGVVVVGVLCVVSTTTSCARSRPDEPPVARPGLKLSRDKVAIGSPVTLTYTFDVLPHATLTGDYHVFVHVVSSDGEMLWTDDHIPPIPVSQWAAGQHVEYARTIFAPNYPYIGDAYVRIGVFAPRDGGRLPLQGEDVFRKEYVVGKFQIRPQSENIFLYQTEGWNQPEIGSTTEWTWTKKAAGVAFRNPRKDVLLYLQFDARPDILNPPQQVTVRVGEQIVSQFAADSKDLVLKTIPISSMQLGSEEQARVVIEVDRTFVPGGADTRELGLRVFHYFVEAK
jgi:hypothetical protein